MENLFVCQSVSCSEWLMLFLGFILTILWSLFIFSLRPKICIENPSINDKPKLHLRIPIINKGKIFDANKITIEAAVVQDSNTFHFDIDFKEYVLIPCKKRGDPQKVYKAYHPSALTAEIYVLNINKLIELSKNKDSNLRIRIHVNHELTGLGKSFQQYFQYNNGSFIKIKTPKNNYN